MSKREATQIAAAAGVDVDAPRAKRRKEALPDSKPVAGTSSMDAVKKEGEEGEPKRDSPEVIKDKGLKLWTTAKDAVDKEGRSLSVDFMRLPSKRQYPDYYVQIKRPIALDDIKAQLDALAYASFTDVKHDLEACFRNAKRYNIKESQIFQDAKTLHKLVKKEYAKMTGTTEEAAEDEGDEHAGDGVAHEGGSEEEGGKKKKPPNMNRLLKTRLQKLVEKTDDSGRVLSTEFMELPNRKQWPIYYKTIKRPQCLEIIFKRLKRKEYHTSQEFANDVELVFSNALEFNQDHTEIWEDAIVLRDHFRHLMIRLKVPAAHHPSATSTPAQPSPTPGTLKIRAHYSTANGAISRGSPPGESSKSPAVPAQPVPAAASPPLPPAGQTSSHPIVPAPVPAVAQLKASASGSNVLPNAYPQAGYSPYAQYTHPAYQQLATSAATPATPVPAPSVSPVQAVAVTTTEPQSPSDPQKHRSLKTVTLLTKPLGRLLLLDHTDGVRTWAVRLCGETSVRVSGVRFLKMDTEDEESSDDEEKGKKLEDEDEEVEKEKGKEKEGETKPEKRKRGRPKKKKQPVVEEVKAEETAKKKGKARARPPPGETQVKLNGVVANALDDGQSEWDLDLPIGPNVVEIGEKGGTPWRVYLDRVPV
ncbi:Bromodomain-containing protein [Fomitopsis serialis]|uniref:Bromodomain-containing protein n=1 Tax=Fomitopsis serialis TaxID=139415 RepID=UPI0020079D59|nr:Bromodomain-containing protein [Neoantrodia serialis]KAH9923634.1 Bromodomain-containing protein [Neoantrodia serialis]